MARVMGFVVFVLAVFMVSAVSGQRTPAMCATVYLADTPKITSFLKKFAEQVCLVNGNSPLGLSCDLWIEACAGTCAGEPKSPCEEINSFGLLDAKCTCDSSGTLPMNPVDPVNPVNPVAPVDPSPPMSSATRPRLFFF